MSDSRAASVPGSVESLVDTVAYSIAGCSEHSSRYVADNILVDNPKDQSSRWSGLHEDPHVKQWLLLRLDNPSIIHSITFGKYHKSHPCNMKEFKILIGMGENDMTEVLHASLKDDNAPETFPLRHMKAAGVYAPSRFLKIIPLTAHSSSYHISIWHVALKGVKEPAFMQGATSRYEQYREAAALRHILKHLRTRGLLAPYKALLAASDVQLEHPLVTRLYESIVSHADWSAAEEVIRSSADSGLFDAYLQSSPPRAVWKRLQNSDFGGPHPCRRGGHAMCIDEEAGIIYLFGGFDGQRSLDDFWSYSIADDSWELISEHASLGPGPSARSCHRMIFDSRTGCIYVLGRLTDGDGDADDGMGGAHTRESSADSTSFQDCPGDFWRYHTQGPIAGSWELLSDDTSDAGGPLLLFDHQMVMDSAAQTLYVCGGRVHEGHSSPAKYSGLYSYEVASQKWTLLQPRAPSGVLHSAMWKRYGHCMVFDPSSRCLIIFSGMGDDDHYLSDMYSYEIDTNTATQLYVNFSSSGGPDKNSTQRAVIDPSLQEIYVLCGLTRNRAQPSRTESSTWLYKYEEQPGRWAHILPEASGSNERSMQPRTRYGHQIVYDLRSKTIYLHGGNAGPADDDGHEEADAIAERRLDDLWCMMLKRPEPQEAVRRAKFELRCQQFREMCDAAPAVEALKFLQSQVAEVVDHNTPETDTFSNLLSLLLTRQQQPSRPSPESSSSNAADNDLRDKHQTRIKVFESLLELYPADAKQPSPNLVDMVDWYEQSAHE
ncbi:hypothetical protein PENSPDRAFT_74325 [Peniophora sp. CONT]|nr:hypothetical protein PENSPDRAFT_74325 [Peniophora sp. CONT]